MVATRWLLRPAAVWSVVLLLSPACADDGNGPLTLEDPGVTIVSLASGVAGVVGDPTEPAPRVRVMDGKGNALRYARVRFDVVAGGGSLRYADTLTDGQGEARAEWVLGTNTLVRNELRVRAGASNAALFFMAQPRPGLPDRITKTSNVDSVTFSREHIAAPKVRVVDRFGNGVPGVIVDFEVTAGHGRLDASDSPRVTTTNSGHAVVGRWILGGPGMNVLKAQAAGLGSISFETMAIDSAAASWYITAPQPDASYGTLLYKLALDREGFFIQDTWSVDGHPRRVARFAGRYFMPGLAITLTGCSMHDEALHCSVKTGRVNGTVIVLGSIAYHNESTRLGPAFPIVEKPGRIFEGVDSPYYAYHGSKLASRYVLYDDKTFALQYSSWRWGVFEYRGWYSEVDSLVTFTWEGWSTAGPWGATGTLIGDSLAVKYNIIMALSDFEDGLYVRKK
jgi:hypothetical protein